VRKNEFTASTASERAEQINNQRGEEVEEVVALEGLRLRFGAKNFFAFPCVLTHNRTAEGFLVGSPLLGLFPQNFRRSFFLQTVGHFLFLFFQKGPRNSAFYLVDSCSHITGNFVERQTLSFV
jgi:hypothetical protein